MRPTPSTAPYLVLLASIVFLRGTLAQEVAASGKPRPTNDVGSRGEQAGKARAEAGQLVSGSPPHLQSVVAGTPPTAVMSLVPVPAKVGSYPAGTTIVGNELTAITGGFRAWFELKLSDWDPNGDNMPPLDLWQFQIDTNGFYGENADPPNPGVDLIRPVVSCAGNPFACGAAFGEPWAPCLTLDRTCSVAYTGVNTMPRSDAWCFPGCEMCLCETGYPSIRCFCIYGPATGRPDEGIEYYGATVVLDIPEGAEGKYTVNLVPNGTWLEHLTLRSGAL